MTDRAWGPVLDGHAAAPAGAPTTLINPADETAFAEVRPAGPAEVETGVVSDGLSTTVLPAASAGASFQTAIIMG